MPTLHPFRPVTFAVGGDISTKIAPPYDVLDEGPKRALLARDPHNIVAVDLPVTPPKTVGPDAAYVAAGAVYRDWLADGVLRRADRPVVCAYEQAYAVGHAAYRRRGLFATLGLEPFNRPGGGVFRHEMTIAGGVGDRTKLMAATHAQLSPVFGVFRDPQGTVNAALASWFDHREPDFFGTTEDQTLHRVWMVDDAAVLASLQAFFAPTNVYIADGHHRYTTALDFSKSHAKLPGAKNGLFVLVAAEDPGMIVLPTHRVVTGLAGFSMEKLAAIIHARSDMRLRDGAADARFVLVDPVTRARVGLEVDDDALDAVRADMPEVWRRLDVALLHELVMDRVLRPAFGGDAVGFKYTPDEAEVLRMLDGTRDRLGVLVRSTPLQAVMAVSDADAVMPPKSTYFFPKLATGLVVHDLA